MAREAYVAGQFYPGDKNRLIEELLDIIPENKNKINAIGAVSPHAGYTYSGAVAGEVYAKLNPKGTYVILSPNHSGYGADFAASAEPWRTPLGPVEIDRDLLGAAMRRTGLIVEDRTAHAFEHSAEVQIPFIQMTAPGAKIVPITVRYGSLDELKEVAEALAAAVKDKNGDALIISSSDMTHYESRQSAGRKDRMAIQKVLELDAEGLLDVVERNDISMCGYVPTAIMLMCAKALDASKAELVKYIDSGDVTGDTAQVVGYAGIVVY